MGKESRSSSVVYKANTGRKKEVKELLKCLQSGQNVAIIAPRRFGKTALIAQALLEIRAKDISTTYIDMLPNSTSELLSSSLIRETLKNHKLHKEFLAARKNLGSFYTNKALQAIAAAFPYMTRLDDHTMDSWELLSNCLDFPHLLSASLNQEIVCAYDHYGEGIHSESGGRLATLLTSKIGQHSSNAHLMAGRNESAFLSIKGIHLIRMGYIEFQTLIDSLNKKFSQLKIKLPRKYSASMVNLTKGHPYYTRLAFEQIILAHSQLGAIPSAKDLRNLLMAAEKSYIENVWEDLSRNKEYLHTMIALCRGSENIYQRLKAKKINVARAQNKLEGMGYLMKRKSGGYSIADPLLEYWLSKIN